MTAAASEQVEQPSREKLLAMVIRQREIIARLEAEVVTLKAEMEKFRRPSATSRNSSRPPSLDQKANSDQQRKPLIPCTGTYLKRLPASLSGLPSQHPAQHCLPDIRHQNDIAWCLGCPLRLPANKCFSDTIACDDLSEHFACDILLGQLGLTDPVLGFNFSRQVNEGMPGVVRANNCVAR
jgi:hypothetical protein